MTKEQILNDIIKEVEWGIKYHADKLVKESKQQSPKEWDMNYHRQKLERESVLLEALKRVSNENKGTTRDLPRS